MTPFFWFRWARRIVSALVSLFILGAFVVCSRVWYVGVHDQRPHVDAILVMGAAQYDGRPSEVFKARLDHARGLFDQGIAPRIVTVGGGRTGDRVTEAEAGQSYLKGQGVSTSRIVVVPEGSDSLLSLRAAAEVFSQRGWKSVVIVTDKWHELRSRTMAHDLGLKAYASPAVTGPSTKGMVSQGRYIAREGVAYVYYRLFHRASRAGPPAL